MTMSKTLGLTFSETMSGGFLLGATDPTAGERQGNAHRSQLTLHCQVTIDDLDKFAQDPQHPGRLSGTVDFSPLATGIACSPGVFKLFCPANAPDEKFMVYQLGFEVNGKSYFLAGKKIVRKGQETQVLHQTTTLFTLLYEGNDTVGPIRGAGALHLGATNIAQLVETTRVINAENSFETMRGLAIYLKLFLGELWHTYL
jgi:hypothetical protein